MTRVLQECVRLNCRGPAGALVVTRPQGVKLLGAEMKIRIRRHCFSLPCANALIEAEDWEGPEYQACVNASNVSRKFPLESNRRRLDLTSKHHAEVAALSAAERLARYRSFMVCGLNCRRA